MSFNGNCLFESRVRLYFVYLYITHLKILVSFTPSYSIHVPVIPSHNDAWIRSSSTSNYYVVAFS